MFKNSKKAICNRLIENLEQGEKFYKFSHVDSNDKVVYFDGKKPSELYGFPIPVEMYGQFFPEFIYDIAYEKEGKLYRILTNKEVVVIKEGLNVKEENQILAAASIKPATASDLSRYVTLITYKDNMKQYVKSRY